MARSCAACSASKSTLKALEAEEFKRRHLSHDRSASDLEGLAAAAAALLIGIVELEAFLQAFARVVELGAVQIRQTLFVNEHLHAETFPNFIVGFD